MKFHKNKKGPVAHEKSEWATILLIYRKEERD